MSNPIRELQYYEQYVNNRYGTSAAPDIDPTLLPEAGKNRRLIWRSFPRDRVAVYASKHKSVNRILSSIVRGDFVNIPIHPLEETRLQNGHSHASGSISISASYRTVFFEPEIDGFLHDCVGDGDVNMLKLHLEKPLPGVAGDRRLTRSKVEKCITLSDVLPGVLSHDPMASQCQIVPEILGLAHEQVGVIFRQVPMQNLLPVFSLSSPDSRNPDSEVLIVARLRSMYGSKRMFAAKEIGDQLAKPLVRSLLAGFRAGFSMEMHAQNVLVKLGTDSLIDTVYFRDLEGVVFSDRYRLANSLEPLFDGSDNTELVSSCLSMQRWYNRNVDHDLGRIFSAALEALRTNGYFTETEVAEAVRSIRRTLHSCVREAGLGKLDFPGRILPFSRSPYGNGLSKGHYYRTRYR